MHFSMLQLVCKVFAFILPLVDEKILSKSMLWSLKNLDFLNLILEIFFLNFIPKKHFSNQIN